MAGRPMGAMLRDVRQPQFIQSRGREASVADLVG